MQVQPTYDELEKPPGGWKSWVLATRPKTLTAAFVPVVVATLLAYSVKGMVDLGLSISALLAALFIQIGTNLINDALDFKKGVDTSTRIGPMRATQMGLLTMAQVLAGGIACLFLSILFAIPLMVVGGVPIIAVMVLSVLCAYCYTGGPYPLAYYGLGDLFVLLFFGFIAVGTVYYLQVGTLEIGAIVAGAQIGFLSMVMLAVNNLRDHEGDARANKRTLVVRFGPLFGRVEITLLCMIPFLLSLYWIQVGKLFAAGLPFLLFPLATLLIRSVWTHEPGKIYNQFLGLSALLHVAFGLLLSLGFVIK